MADKDARHEKAMKIMIASDIHLGYNEKDPERGNDSFNTFEEILQLSVHFDVDFILLGGDLFHDNNPSTHCMNRCMKLLRIYCMGDKPIEVEFLSDQAANFMKSITKTVNYEDPNLNIAIPVFSIHGNHDDPSGFGSLSSLDLLSTSGLLNYFGNWEDVTKIHIDPIMLRKEETKVAIYGLSYIHDNRLCRLFEDGKVSISLPEDSDSWFNIFVVHQNRANRGVKNFLPEEVLPSFIDLVIWGHEHDCRIEPEKNAKRNFFVSQPGSTVATSLAQGEALPKHCALLYVEKGDFKMDKIPLKTVRPFVFANRRIVDVIDEEYLDEGRVEEKVRNYVKKTINEMLEEAKALVTGHDMQPKLPLVRLRLEVTEDCQMFHPIQFGQDYGDLVANPSDMILFSRKFQKIKHDVELDKDLIEEAFNQKQSGEGSNKVEDVIQKYFEEASGKHQLKVLSIPALQEMTRFMIKAEARDDDKRKEIIDFYIDRCVASLGMTNKEDIPDKMAQFRINEKDTFDNLLKILDKKIKKTEPMDVDSFASTSSAPARGGRGRGSKTTTTRAAPKKPPISVTSSRNRKTNKVQYIESDSD